MPEPVAALPDAPAPMGLLARAAGIVTCPSRVFEQVRENPACLGALLLGAAAVGISAWWTGPIVIEDQIETARRAGTPMDADAVETLRIFTEGILRGSNVLLGGVSVAGMTTGLAGILFVVFQMIAGTGRYKQVLSVVSHAGLVQILGAPVAAGLAVATGTVSGGANLGAALRFALERDTWLYRFLHQADFFILWQVGLTAIGLSIVYRRTFLGAAIPVFGLWAAVAAITSVSFTELVPHP